MLWNIGTIEHYANKIKILRKRNALQRSTTEHSSQEGHTGPKESCQIPKVVIDALSALPKLIAAVNEYTMPSIRRQNSFVSRRSPRDHRANRILGSLEEADYAFLEPYLEAAILPRGIVLYEPGDPIQYTYFPHDAIVSLIDVMADGRQAEVGIFGCEGCFGLLSSFFSREAFGRYVVQIPGSASRVPVEAMHEAMKTRPEIRRLILAYNEALLAQAYHSVACNALHAVEARCSRWILTTRDRHDEDALPLTHEFLAEMLGVQRSTVSSILRAFQQSGLIEQRRGVIVIADRDGLEHEACECYRKIHGHFQHLTTPRQRQFDSDV